MPAMNPNPSLSAPVEMDIASIIAGLPSDVVDKIARHFENTPVGEEEKGFLDVVEESLSTRRAALRLLNGRIALNRGHTDLKRWALFSSERVKELSIVAPRRWWDVTALEPLVQCMSLTSLSLRGCAFLIRSLCAPVKRLSLLISTKYEVEPVRTALRGLNPLDLDLSVTVPFSSFCSLHVLRDALVLPSVRTLTLACNCKLPSGSYGRNPNCIALEIAARLPVLDRFVYRSKDPCTRDWHWSYRPGERDSGALCFTARLGFLFRDVFTVYEHDRVCIEGRGRTDGHYAPPQCFANERNGLFESPQRSLSITGGHSQLIRTALGQYFQNAPRLNCLRLSTGPFHAGLWDGALRAFSPGLRQLHVQLACQLAPDVRLWALFREILQSCRGLQVLSLGISGQNRALRRRVTELERETEETEEIRSSLLNQWALMSSQMPDLLVLDAEHGETVRWEFLDIELYGSREE